MKIGEKVYVTLRRRLMSGFYDPGIQLKEELIADELDVSRTPVRSAIQRLIAEGLLEPAAKRGAVVTQWQKSEAEDIFHLRIMLEGMGASLAAEKISEDLVERMEYLNNHMQQAVLQKKDNYIRVIHEANLEFHKIIIESSRNRHLRLFCSQLLEYPMVIGGFYLYSDEDMEESIRQHKEIIAGLKARSPEWAKSAMTCHLTAAIERFKRSECSTRPLQPGTDLTIEEPVI